MHAVYSVLLCCLSQNLFMLYAMILHAPQLYRVLRHSPQSRSAPVHPSPEVIQAYVPPRSPSPQDQAPPCTPQALLTAIATLEEGHMLSQAHFEALGEIFAQRASWIQGGDALELKKAFLAYTRQYLDKAVPVHPHHEAAQLFEAKDPPIAAWSAQNLRKLRTLQDLLIIHPEDQRLITIKTLLECSQALRKKQPLSHKTHQVLLGYLSTQEPDKELFEEIFSYLEYMTQIFNTQKRAALSLPPDQVRSLSQEEKKDFLELRKAYTLYQTKKIGFINREAENLKKHVASLKAANILDPHHPGCRQNPRARLPLMPLPDPNLPAAKPARTPTPVPAARFLHAS